VRYGDAVLLFLTSHKIGFAVSVAGIIVFLYLITRLIFPKASATP
jgi:FtsH-binding integral membrane protein